MNKELKPMDGEEIMPLLRMAKDLKAAIKNFDRREARYMTDLYYQMQDNRTRTDKQIKGLERGADDAPGGTHLVLDWFSNHARNLENQVKLALGHYASAHEAGRWAMSQMGCGPVIAAGLLAHIDIHKAPTAGHVWSFAGLEPDQSWKKGQKRPWNSQLKCLCTYKLGECLVKVSKNPEAYYGQVYRNRKAYEWGRNLSGEGAEAAQKGKSGMDKAKKTGSEGYKWYSGRVSKSWAEQIISTESSFPAIIPKSALDQDDSQPMIPPAQVHARARRYAVKLFLSHYHDVLYRDTFKKAPPKPYPIEHLGHAHHIPPHHAA